MQTELQSYDKGLESSLAAMQAEGEKKLADYQQNEATMSDLVKQDKVRELESIQQRILEFQQNAQESLAAKEQELITPILDKARKAIEDVAKEGNFTYIFDTRYRKHFICCRKRKCFTARESEIRIVKSTNTTQKAVLYELLFLCNFDKLKKNFP